MSGICCDLDTGGLPPEEYIFRQKLDTADKMFDTTFIHRILFANLIIVTCFLHNKSTASDFLLSSDNFTDLVISTHQPLHYLF